MLIKSRGIIFRKQKFKESSLILDIYTEEHGLLSFVVNGVRKPKSKISSSAVQLMALVDIVGYYRENKDLQRLKEIKVYYIYERIPFEVKRGAIGTFLLELCRNTIRERESNPILFSFIERELIHLDLQDSLDASFHLKFICSLGGQLGILAPLDEDISGNIVFDMREGLFTDQIPFHKDYIDGERAKNLSLALNSSAYFPKLDRSEKQAFIRNMMKYFSIHIENMKPVKSHLILEVVLSN